MRGIAITPGRDGNYQIFNNFIALDQNGPATVSACYGVLVSGSVPFTFSFDFNSVNVGGVHSGGTAGNVLSAAFVKTASNDTSVFKIRNNLFKNTRTGGVAGGYHSGSFINAPNGVAEMNYNVSYSAGSVDNFHAGWGTTLYNDLAQYKTAAGSFEANTIFKDITYTSATDLHLVAPSDGDPDLAGTPIAGILTDIDNQVRNASTPYRGADEATNPVPVELASFAATVMGNAVTLKWTTATEKNNNGFQVERKQASGEWQSVGFVKGKGTTLTVSEYSFVESDLASGKYSYRLKQIDFDGSSQYHQLAGEVVIGVPTEFAISQNYPNPFNPSTMIDYTVADVASVTIELFDMTGSKITDLFTGVAEAGYYSLSLDIHKLGLSSGNYIYRFTATNLKDGKQFNSVKKMTLLK